MKAKRNPLTLGDRRVGRGNTKMALSKVGCMYHKVYLGIQVDVHSTVLCALSNISNLFDIFPPTPLPGIIQTVDKLINT